jgi:hypothetical protein
MILLWQGWWLARHVLHSWLVSFCTQLGFKCSKLASYYTCWLLIENLDYKNISNDIILLNFIEIWWFKTWAKLTYFSQFPVWKPPGKQALILGPNFFFGAKFLHLVTKEKGLHQSYTGLFFLRKMAQSDHISRTKKKHKAEFTGFRQ